MPLSFLMNQSLADAEVIFDVTFDLILAVFSFTKLTGIDPIQYN